MLDKNLERRRFPRGRGDVDYLFAVQVEDIVTETKNISIGGMMCMVNRSFKLGSVIHTAFILPVYAGQRVSFNKIHCKARVMRCEACPEIDDPDCHAIGVEFIGIKDTEREQIARFVKHSFSTVKKGKKSHPVSVRISHKR